MVNIFISALCVCVCAWLKIFGCLAREWQTDVILEAHVPHGHYVLRVEQICFLRKTAVKSQEPRHENGRT